MKALLSGLAALMILTAHVSCGGGTPAPPKPGSPAFFWAAAQESYKTGDYLRTDSNLAEISRSENDFTRRARPWHIVVASGIAQGYSELSEAYADGAKVNRQSSGAFLREMRGLRAMAANASVTLTELVHLTTDLDKDPMVSVSFEPPSGPTEGPPNLRKIAAGVWVPDAERDALQTEMVRRGVRLAAKRLLSGSAGRVPREGFLFTAAVVLYDQSQLFGRTKLDQPKRLRTMCDEALQALQAVPETAERRDAARKIKSTMKKLGTT